DGFVRSTRGKVFLSADNNLYQNGEVFGANGVTATARGTMLFGPLATSGNLPVSYSINGITVSPPPAEVGGGLAATSGIDVLVTFLDKFQAAVQEQQAGASDTNAVGSKKKKSDDTIVTEGEVCR
ncbi:MAG: hypothetical protein LH632_03990, partial [Rhodoferax sp.]|nr:hypothetical protein [Rhodoferax sp.]